MKRTRFELRVSRVRRKEHVTFSVTCNHRSDRQMDCAAWEGLHLGLSYLGLGCLVIFLAVMGLVKQDFD